MKKITLFFIFSLLVISSANAEMSKANKNQAWECSGIYMANYFLPSGETFEYSMKEKSMASVKVLKNYALEIGVNEQLWDKGVNKAVDKHYGSKFNEEKTEGCHAFLERLIPNGKKRVSKVVQTLY
jgi:hypothetical protein